jgi:hypothetical protein
MTRNLTIKSNTNCIITRLLPNHSGLEVYSYHDGLLIDKQVFVAGDYVVIQPPPVVLTDRSSRDGSFWTLVSNLSPGANINNNLDGSYSPEIWNRYTAPGAIIPPTPIPTPTPAPAPAPVPPPIPPTPAPAPTKLADDVTVLKTQMAVVLKKLKLK